MFYVLFTFYLTFDLICLLYVQKTYLICTFSFATSFLVFIQLQVLFKILTFYNTIFNVQYDSIFLGYLSDVCTVESNVTSVAASALV